MHSHTYQQRWLNVSVCKSHAPREFSTRRVVDVCAFWLNYGQQSAVQKELTYFYGGLTPFRSLLKSTHRTCKYNIRAFEFSRAKHPFFLHIFPSLALSLAFQLPCHRVPKLCFCSWGGNCHVWYVIRKKTWKGQVLSPLSSTYVYVTSMSLSLLEFCSFWLWGHKRGNKISPEANERRELAHENFRALFPSLSSFPKRSVFGSRLHTILV